MMTSSGYPQHILRPTRITEYTSTIIDAIYSNNFEDNLIGGNILVQFADHLAQFLSIEKNVDRVKPMDVFKLDYSNFDENTFLEDIATQDWSTDNNTNIYFNNFLTTLETCIDRHPPITIAWILQTFETRQKLPMLTLWKFLVRLILEYCSVLWSPMKNGLIQNI